jgi:hypothetical protein
MEDRPSLAQRVSDKLDAGALPSIAPLKLWGGFGTGNPGRRAASPSTRRNWSTRTGYPMATR